MGMLLSYHKGYGLKTEAKAKRTRKRGKANAEAAEPQAAPVTVEGYESLSDDEVAEAYATNVAYAEDRTEPLAETREDQVAELEALDAEPAAEPAS